MQAQGPFFQHFQVEDGLAQQTVYSILQDSKGYLWFGSAMGVSRFNGLRFEVFTKEDGLAEEEIYKIFEDSRGRIWFNGEKNLSWYEEGKFHNFRDTLNGKFSIQGIFRGFYEHTNGDIYIGTHHEGALIVRADGRLEKLSYTDESQNCISTFMPGPAGTVRVISKAGAFLVDEVTGEYRDHANEEVRMGRVSFFHHTRTGEIYEGLFQDLFRIDSTSRTKVDPGPLTQDLKRINFIYESPSGDLWLGTVGGAFRIRNKIFSEENITQFLPAERISAILQDQEGNFWFSTLDHGLFFAPSLAVNLYANEDCFAVDRTVSVGKNQAGDVFVGGLGGYYSCISGNKISRYQLTDFLIPNGQNVIKRIRTSPEGDAWLISDDMVTRIREGKATNFFLSGNMKDLVWDSQGNLIWSTNRHVYRMPAADLENFRTHPNTQGKEWYERFIEEKLVTYSIFPGWSNGILVDAGGKIWINSDQGLFVVKGKQIRSLAEQIPQNMQGPILDMVEILPGVVAILVSSRGLMLMTENQLFTLSSGSILPRSLSRMQADGKGNLWLSSNEGLFRLSPDPHKGLKVEHIGIQDGLASPVTEDLLVDGDLLWTVSPKGVIQIDLAEFSRKPYLPPVFIERVTEESSGRPVSLNETLSHTQNNLKIAYVGLSFRNRNHLFYKYRLRGLSGNWNITQNPDVVFLALPPGKYTFEIVAGSPRTGWSEKPAVFSFYIQPALWQRWWFWALVFLALTSLVWSFLYYRFKALRERAQLIQKTAESEQKALRAQMTPHFIFNSLNSIQQLISDENRVEALRFTSKFSRLMRRIMENSRHKFITLSEEIETLRLYLEIESLRFEQKFNFEIGLSPEIDAEDIEIPPMIIQPYVENSIWHGLLHKDGGGLISIQLKLEGDFLICYIEDNGIGRKASGDLKSKHDQKHASVGMALTLERLELLGSAGNLKSSVQVVDLHHPDGSPAGTRVELYIFIA
ncbi:MAG: histidine kinase [Bacteroidia bacterium]|nr:histidine kinase [Bacteroidia bacterium]